MESTRDTMTPLLIRADRIHTGDGTVEALLVGSGRVLAVGRSHDLEPLAPDGRILDLPGLTVTPGLTDAHVHLVEWALARRQADLTGAGSPGEAVRRVADWAASAGSVGGWLRGRGWNAHLWRDAPHRDILDAVLGDRPVLLQSQDMHSLWASSAALARAGIDASTPDPDGGRIERDPGGRPTGVLRDNAMPLLLAAAPDPTDADRVAALGPAQAALHRFGVTGVHTVEPGTLGLLERLRDGGDLRLRVLQHLSLTDLDDAIRVGLRSGFGGDLLRLGGIKMFLDGALGSCTAWLREPYEGSDDRGVSTLPPADFRDVVRRGSAAGLAMTVHAIGDAAMDLALDVLTRHVDELDGPVPHRIEHAQLIGPDRLGLEADSDEPPRAEPGMRRLVYSVQPSHLMTDWPAADRLWGDRSRWAYAYGSMARAGLTLALGSDAPVDPPDPRLGLYAATARQDLDGEPAGGWNLAERLSTERALAGYTTGAATAAGDRRQGRLLPGSFADLVGWDGDPIAASPDALLGIEAKLTMVAGETVWSD